MEPSTQTSILASLSSCGFVFLDGIYQWFGTTGQTVGTICAIITTTVTVVLGFQNFIINRRRIKNNA